jgi:Bacterial Ig domain
MKTAKSIVIGLLFGGWLMIGLQSLRAQETVQNDNPIVNGGIVNGLTDFQVELRALESTPPLPASALPKDVHGFYSVQNPKWPPLPGDVLNLPVWPLGDGTYAIDDRAVNYSELAQQQTLSCKSGMQMMDDSDENLSFPANTNFTIFAQETNIVLHWISNTNRIYLLEDRPTLTSESQWSELVNYYLAAANTNVTTFVHSNIIQLQPANFYRLFDVTPVARDDFFTIDQDSSANQLDIFQNDYDPNDDLFYIYELTPAAHGSIEYSSDASTFQYTPDFGFYGVDTFQYSVTSGYGETSSNATVTVFVNQSGNSPPSANDLIITLQTNVYSTTFNALTNSSDPDGDTVTLFAVNPPNLGSVSNDADGNIIYCRNPNVFGDDSFTYIITDGKGGYGVGNVKILQQDTTGTGLPDQWNLANGFDPTVDNSMADPDGDGLPNLAEFALGTNPNVPDNPLNLSGVTNGTQVSEFAQLPLYGINLTIQNPPVTLFVNGAPAENSYLLRGPDGRWLMNWDTSFLTNGSYQIQLDCQVAPPDSPDSISDVFGTNVTVQVNNPIVFDKLTSQFSDFLYIYGTLADTNDTYDVYLYDDDGNLLVYATGLSAPNGQIALGWDLTDGEGHQISFGNIQAVFYLHSLEDSGEVHPLDSPSSPSAYHWFIKDVAGSIDNNVFSAAWGWDTYSLAFNNYREECMDDGVINVLGNPAADNTYFLLPTANIPYGGSSFRYDSESDKQILMHALNVSENFFWFGHGGFANIFGNPTHSALAPSDVETLLNNKAFRSTPKTPRTNKHPYFLAILNACETYDRNWAGAFGIDFSANGSSDSVDDYQYYGLAPRAFVGWTKEIGVPGGNDLFWEGILDADYGDALAYMFQDWMAGYPIYQCVGDFSTQALYLVPLPSLFQNLDSWQISGCVDLRRGD